MEFIKIRPVLLPDIIRRIGKLRFLKIRLDDSSLSREELITENERNLQGCIQNQLDYILIDENYAQSMEGAKLC